MNVYEKRISNVQKLLKNKKADGMVVTRVLENAYLTGYSMSGVILLITQAETFAIMPKMLYDDFKAKVPFIKSFAVDKLMDGVLSQIKDLKLKKVVFEPETETYVGGKYWKEHGLEECSELISSLRLIKDEEEIKILRESCQIAAKAYEQLLPFIKTGCTEIFVSRKLEDLMQDMGAKCPSFDLIVAFGENSALPHHVTSERKLKDNEAVLIDFGCIYRGYCSDITRTFFNGTPDEEFKKVYSIVQHAHDAGLKALKDGLKAKAADAVCRDIISDEGYGQYFIHSTGHGVGLEIHEAPALSVRADEKYELKAGMAVTIEPGIYLNGKFGIRIEDSALITKKGCEVLTKIK